MKQAISIGANQSRFWRETAFYAALLAGPVCWLIILLLGQPLIGPPDLIFWLKLSVVMPVLEEIVFRGGVQAALFSRSFFAQRWFGISLANVITSVIFAAVHLFSQPPLWAALIFIPSLVFGWARDRYDSVVPAVILHSVYNAGFVWLFVA